MTTFNLASIMDGIVTTLVAANVVTDAAHAYAYPVESWNSPCVIVGYPSRGQILFDQTFKRGFDEATFPLWFVAGRVNNKATRDLLSGIIDGAAGVKGALEAQPATLGGHVSSVRITDADVQELTDGAGEPYIAMRFDLQVFT